MNNIANIKNNLSNVVYLYENFRFDNALDCLTVEYDDKIPVKELKQVLKNYFVDRPIDSIDVGQLQHLDVDEDVALYSSYSAFRRISGVVVDGKKKLISFQYSFLTSVERAQKGLKLLECDNIEEFKRKYPELTELALFDETDHIMMLMQHLDSLVTLKDEEE